MLNKYGELYGITSSTLLRLSNKGIALLAVFPLLNIKDLVSISNTASTLPHV